MSADEELVEEIKRQHEITERRVLSHVMCGSGWLSTLVGFALLRAGDPWWLPVWAIGVGVMVAGSAQSTDHVADYLRKAPLLGYLAPDESMADLTDGGETA